MRNRAIRLVEHKRLSLELEKIAALFDENNASIKIQKVLGQGLFAATYKGKTVLGGYARVVRVLRRNLAHEPRIRAEFMDLVNRSTKYIHQNLVLTRDTGQFPDADIFYCVQDYVDGGTLQDALDEGTQFNVAQVLEIGRQVVRALEPIHEEHEVHGSIKPSNIFISKTDRVERKRDRIKLGDPSLPVSFINLNVDRLTYDYCYVAPEAFSGDRKLVPASDFYSLGCVLHQLAYGSPPFVADNPVELASLHMSGNLPATGPEREGFTPAFYAILVWLLRRNPLDRPRSIEQVIDRIDRVAAGAATRDSQGPERVFDTQFGEAISPDYSIVSFSDPGDVYGTVIRRTDELPSEKPPGVEKGDIAAEEESPVRPKSTGMTAERWQQINALLDAVLHLPPGEQQAYLDLHCPDPELRQEVRSLLEAHDGAQSFLEEPAKGFDSPLIPVAKDLAADRLVGQEIDGYRILDVLGRGGMGIVYKALDINLDKVVALKMIDPVWARDEASLW